MLECRVHIDPYKKYVVFEKFPKEYIKIHSKKPETLKENDFRVDEKLLYEGDWEFLKKNGYILVISYHEGIFKVSNKMRYLHFDKSAVSKERQQKIDDWFIKMKSKKNRVVL